MKLLLACLILSAWVWSLHYLLQWMGGDGLLAWGALVFPAWGVFLHLLCSWIREAK